MVYRFLLFFFLANFGLSPVLAASPEDDPEELLAARYFREGRYAQAASIYQDLFRTSPTVAIYNNYLESLLFIEEFQRAEDVVRSQMRAQSNDIRYDVDLGWVFHRSGRSRQERRQMEGLIDNLTADSRRVIGLAAAFEHRGFMDRALEAYYRGRQLLGESHSLHLRIAELLGKMGRHEAMMGEYLDYMNQQSAQEVNRVRGILQDLLDNDPGYSRNEALRTVLLTRTQRNPDHFLYAEMLLWLSLQQQDFSMALRQARALDRRLQQTGNLVMEVATLSANNKAYQVASQAFQHVLDLGPENRYHMDALIGYLNVRFHSIVSDHVADHEDLLGLERGYHRVLDTLALNAGSVQLLRNLAQLKAFHLNRPEEAIELLEASLELPRVSERVKGECKIELADILVLTGEVWDAILLYAQVDRMFRDDPLAHEAKFKHARLSYYMSEFDWARAQLDILKAGTSRFIANDAMRLSLRIQDNIGFDGNTRPLELFAQAEQRIFMHLYPEATALLDSISNMFPGHAIQDDVLMARAEIAAKTGDFRQADSLYARVTDDFSQGVLADEALFRRAEMHHHIFGQNDKAMALYQRLFLDFPGSLHASTARNRFRTLRGDILN